jgi:tetratricopeptide (TPR) repeat protein
VYLQLSKLDKAKESFEKALALFQQAHSIFGEADGRLSLGRLYLQQDNVQEAELCFNRALLLYRQAQAPDSDEATALQFLQQLSVRKQQLSQTC